MKLRGVSSLPKRLPPLEGRAVRVRFLPELSAGSRKLYSRQRYGQPVYAGTFIRKRQIVLDRELQRRPKELARILVHELFHFVWVRLGNPVRRSYHAVLLREWKQHARGELGWSAELRKARLPRHLRSDASRAKWRDYACESFCDSAAWLYSGVLRHQEFTLAERHRQRRAAWFRQTFGKAGIPI
ncbi:MAG: hypothetical protein LAP38_17420 [Acidobacteriia bacterium]|nr:hypothetical protein [Terriglobia bacterium]